MLNGRKEWCYALPVENRVDVLCKITSMVLGLPGYYEAQLDGMIGLPKDYPNKCDNAWIFFKDGGGGERNEIECDTRFSTDHDAKSVLIDGKLPGSLKFLWREFLFGSKQHFLIDFLTKGYHALGGYIIYRCTEKYTYRYLEHFRFYLSSDIGGINVPESLKMQPHISIYLDEDLGGDMGNIQQIIDLCELLKLRPINLTEPTRVYVRPKHS